MLQNIGRVVMINGQKLCVLVCLALICVISRNSFSQLPTNVSPDKPVAVKLLEVGKISNRTFIKAMANQRELPDCRVQLYIINYGENREIVRREKLIIDWLSDRRRSYDCSRTTLIREGGVDPKTVFWKVPPGADNPEP